MSSHSEPIHDERTEDPWGPMARTKRRTLLAPYYGPPPHAIPVPARDQLPRVEEPSTVTLSDEPPPPRIKVGIVDASPYYAEAVAYAIEPDERFRPISCYPTPDYIPFNFDGVIVLTARDQRALDDGLLVTAARFPQRPLVVVTPTSLGFEYLSLIAYPGIAFRLNELSIEALKRAIVNASSVAAACGRTKPTAARPLRPDPADCEETEPYTSRVPPPRPSTRLRRM